MRSLFIISTLLVASCSCQILSGLTNTVDGVVASVEDVSQVAIDVLRGGVADAHRDPCQLIESRNFVCETHFVTTEDGYIIRIDHVVNPVLKQKNKPTIKPVVCQHGLFGSATHWLINSEGGFAADWTEQVIDVDLNIEGRNAPYLLSNYGYDLWMPNLRGCRYSRNHTKLNPDTDKTFWDFSYQQMISYDAPTIIDYILKQTKRNELAWIGHSMGNMIMFGLLSQRQEYAKKINPFIALAPVTHVGHVKSPLSVVADVPELKELMTIEGGELSLPDTLLDLLASRVCVTPAISEICESVFALFGGPNPESFNLTRISAYINNGFCGTSVRNLVHFGYNIVKDQFAQFDFGSIDNQKIYGSTDPPQYDLSAITLPNIFLMYSENDWLAVPSDVTTLKNELKVSYTEYVVKNPKFSHLDFLWATDVYEQVYAPMVQYLRKFD